MSNSAILVTGGAGYIGSHVVRQLGEAGEPVVVLDDLSTGFRQAVLHGDLVVGNTGDAACLERLFSDYEIDTVMHFAAHTIVPESVKPDAARVEPCGGRQTRRLLVDRGSLRDSVRRDRVRVIANATDQPVWHIEADD
jgi:dTDP-D-glucose 4,6-dehydratase